MDTDESLPVATLAEIENQLRQAQREITFLRKQNESMGAQLDIVETVRAALLGPRRSGGAMAPDLVRDIDRMLERLVNFPTQKTQGE